MFRPSSRLSKRRSSALLGCEALRLLTFAAGCFALPGFERFILAPPPTLLVGFPLWLSLSLSLSLLSNTFAGFFCLARPSTCFLEMPALLAT